jgi:hypothetical protein
MRQTPDDQTQSRLPSDNAAGQRAHRARCNGAACIELYMDEIETTSQGVDDPPDSQELPDD